MKLEIDLTEKDFFVLHTFCNKLKVSSIASLDKALNSTITTDKMILLSVLCQIGNAMTIEVDNLQWPKGQNM